AVLLAAQSLRHHPGLAVAVLAQPFSDPGDIGQPDLQVGPIGPEALGVVTPVGAPGLPYPDHVPSGLGREGTAALPAPLGADGGEVCAHVVHSSNITCL